MGFPSVGPQGPASAVLGGATLPSSPTARQIFAKTSGGSEGLYICLSNGTWLMLEAASGAGTVTSVSVVTANGVSGSVANPTTTPAITLTLGAITPSSVTDASLTAGRVTYAGTAGLLSDDSGFTYNSGTHTLTTTTFIGAVTGIASGNTLVSVVPNTLPTAGQILAGNAGGTAYAPVSMSGDATLASTGALTLASTITAGGPQGSATVAPVITYDAKGRLTAVTTATITPAVGSITGLGTGVATALGVNVGSAGAFITFNGNAGTPSALVGTNISGTAASLTAGAVTGFTAGAGILTGPASAGVAMTLGNTETVSGVKTFSAANIFLNANTFFGAVQGYMYNNNDELNFRYDLNGSAAGLINNRGYNAGTTQFRDLQIGDGKGAAVAYFTGSTKALALSGALAVTTTLATPIVGPTADSTTAIKFTKADLSTVVGVWDTTNSRLRIGSGTAPTVALDVTGALVVSGAVTATGGTALFNQLQFGWVNSHIYSRGAASSVFLSNGGSFAWNSGTDAGSGGAIDTTISRNAAGVVAVGTTAANALGTLTATNVKLGATTVRGTTEGTNTLSLFNGTAPVGTLTNGASFYSASGEMNVIDAAGNVTLLSPHDHITNEWIFYSKNTVTGRVVKIDMERMMRALDVKLGGGFVHDYMSEEDARPDLKGKH